jgi:uncharacterized membrane protein
MDHLLTITFATQDAARSALDRLHSDAGSAASELDEVCVVSRDLRGAVHVDVGRPESTTEVVFWHRLIEGLAIDGALADADPPAGLPADFVRRVAGSLQPDRSVLLALTNGVDLGPALAIMGRYERLMQCELGDGGGEALRESVAPGVVEPPIWPQSGFGSFQ